ncbi:MAG: HEAT repeat domain-containing protein [Phycisphaeraceae bacterium]
MTTTRPVRSTARRLLLAATCALGALLAAPATEAAPYADGIDLRISPGDEYTQRFSWLHWWETQRPSAQRDKVLESPAAWSMQRLAAIEPYRERLIAALEPLVKDTDADPYARAGAIVALARLRHEKLLELLVSDDAPAADSQPRLGPSGQSWPVGSVGDESVRVRVAGWLALGILDTPESRARLTDEFVWAVTVNDEVARVTAFGLLDKLSKDERDFLVTTMRNSKVAEVQRMALWALDQHDTQDNDPIMRDAVRQLISPYSVAQALQATGPMQRLGTYPLFETILDRPDKLDEITVFNHIERGTVWQSTCTFGVKQQLTVSALLALTELDPATGDTGRALRKALVEQVEEGPATPDRHVQQIKDVTGPVGNYERGPAALALAMQADPKHDLNEHIDLLRKLLDDGYTKADVLVWQRDKQGKPLKHLDPVFVEEQLNQRSHPARGYAAVALGLILQRTNPDTQLGQQRPIALRTKGQLNNVVGDISRTLIKELNDRSGHTDVRSGCAIAMGLSGYDRFRAPLHEALKTLDAGDAALYGYIVEALAMLDDPDAPALAEKYLRTNTTIKHENDRLARRALASALVFSNDTPDDIDKLIQQAWPNDPWVGIELARASAARGGGEMIGYLLDQLESPEHQAAAAICLADVVDPYGPWALSPLTDDMNYTLDFRTPVDVGWNPYKPGDQEPLPTRVVPGFENAYLMHVLLMERLPAGNNLVIVNDDSNGGEGVMFRPTRQQAIR